MASQSNHYSLLSSEEVLFWTFDRNPQSWGPCYPPERRPDNSAETHKANGGHQASPHRARHSSEASQLLVWVPCLTREGWGKRRSVQQMHRQDPRQRWTKLQDKWLLTARKSQIRWKEISKAYNAYFLDRRTTRALQTRFYRLAEKGKRKGRRDICNQTRRDGLFW